MRNVVITIRTYKMSGLPPQKESSCNIRMELSSISYKTCF